MKRYPINFTYFGVFFSFLFFTVILNIFLIEEVHAGEKILYLSYAIGQVFSEVFVLITMSFFIKRYLPKFFYTLFIGLIFFLFILHLIDFTMTRILDLTIFDGFAIVANETLENFLEMISYAEIPKLIWFSLLLILLCVPLFGYYLFYITQKISPKPRVTLLSMSVTTIVVISTTTLLDVLIHDDYSHFEYTHALPLKTYWLPKKETKIDINFKLKQPLCEKQLTTVLTKPLTIQQKPNIFLFIIDSLREDYLTEAIAPTFYHFKYDNIYSTCALASANATQLSWFSIFYGELPFFWKNFDNWPHGAATLNILKKVGYKINVYTAAQLKYYEIGDLLFGKDMKLVDNFHFFSHYGEMDACDSDKLVLDTVLNDLNDRKDGNLFIIFLDSAHWSYSYPQNFPLKFTSLKDGSSPLTPKQVIYIKNRYRNSIHYVDLLFQDFLNNLKEKKQYDDAMIIVTGDHGQEFFEHGHIFHLSQLNNCQTRIPLYFKIGSKKQKIDNLISHIDIFPTILDTILKEKEPIKLFSGTSILQNNHSTVITTRFNAGRVPFEFFIHDGKEKLTLRFSNKNDIFHSDSLQVISLKTAQEEKFLLPSQNTLKYFQDSFKKLLSETN